MMNSKFVLLAVSLLTLSPVAVHATTIDWGHHDSIEYSSVFTEPGAFEDFFAFNLYPEDGLFSTAVSNNIHDVTDISGGTVELFQGSYWDPGADTLVGSYSFDGTTGSSPMLFSPLASGDYYYRVSGTATGTAGGFYSLSSAPIPEPETYLLLALGLGATALTRYRRKTH